MKSNVLSNNLEKFRSCRIMNLCLWCSAHARAAALEHRDISAVAAHRENSTSAQRELDKQ